MLITILLNCLNHEVIRLVGNPNNFSINLVQLNVLNQEMFLCAMLLFCYQINHLSIEKKNIYTLASRAFCFIYKYKAYIVSILAGITCAGGIRSK